MLRAGGVAAVVVFLALVARFWHPVWGFTAFLQLSSSNDQVKIAAFKTFPVYVYPGPGGYDGQYYAQLAYDPTLRSAELAGALDNFGYRARRILPPALAYLIALGRPAWIVHVYSLLNPVAWLTLSVLLWRLLPVVDWRSWLAWFGLMFSTGAIASVRLALTDLVALVILAAAMLALELSRGFVSAGLVAAAALARETSMLAAGGLVDRPWLSPKNVVRLAILVAPLAAWLAYVRWWSGPDDPGWSNLTVPIVGLAGKLRADFDAALHHGDRSLAWTTLLATLGLVVQAVYLAVRPRPGDPWWRIGIAYVLLMLCLNTTVWEGFPGAATRVLLPMALAFNVLTVRRRESAAWIVAGNLAVFSGFAGIRDVPSDPRELAAGHVGGAAVIVRHADGGIDIESWPHDDRDFQISATVRSDQVTLLTITDNGRSVWRNTVFGKPLPLVVPVHVRQGRARLTLSAGTPGIPQGTMSGARSPGLFIENLRLD